MSQSTVLVGVLLMAVTGVFGLVWLKAFSRRCVKVSKGGVRVSWALFCSYFAAQIMIGQRDSGALISDGLSSQNFIQIGVVGLVAVWATWLLASQRVRPRALLEGGSFWVCCQVVLFLLSVLWSVWPPLTLYRAVELGACWVLVTHLFSDGEVWDRVAFRMLAVAAMPSLIIPRLLDLSHGFTLGLGGKSSVGSFVAAALVVITVGQALYANKRPTFWQWGFVVVSAAFSSSLGSAVAMLPALFITASWRLPKVVRSWALCSIILVVVSVVVLVTALSSNALYRLADETARAVGRDARTVYNLTGRLPLWTAILNYTADEPFGLGYVAGERTFATQFANRSEVGWRAINAHNGYISAWVAAGWLGIALAGLLLGSGVFQATGAQAALRPGASGLAVLAMVNNLVIPVTSYAFGPGWLLLIALACLETGGPGSRKIAPGGIRQWRAEHDGFRACGQAAVSTLTRCTQQSR